MRSLLLLISLTASFSLIAQVQKVPDVSIAGNGFINWSQSYKNQVVSLKATGKYSENGILQCSEIKEIPGTILCITGSSKRVGSFFSRASIFAEGSDVDADGKVISKGVVVPRNSVELAVYSKTLGGTDIKGEDLVKFYDKANFECDCTKPVGESMCLSDQEKKIFQDLILPTSQSGKPFVVISTPYRSDRIAGHELIHAQYMLNQKFRDAADEFWFKKLKKSQREEITRTLSKDYDSSDDYLIRNEFFAYTLEPKVRNNFPQFIQAYRDRILSHLKKRGVKLVEINAFEPGTQPREEY